MLCMRLRPFVLSSLARYTRDVRPVTTTNAYLKNENKEDEEKPAAESTLQSKKQSVADLMNALKGLKVDGSTDGKILKTDAKTASSFSAALQFQKLKLLSKSKEKDLTSKKHKEVQELVKEAAVDVAKSFPDARKTQSELLKQLLRHDEATSAGHQGQDAQDVSAILSGIRIQKENRLKLQDQQAMSTPHGDRMAQENFDSTFMEGRSSFTDADRDMDPNIADLQPYKRILNRKTLFDRQRLNLFQPSDPEQGQSTDDVQSIWDIEEEKERQQHVTEIMKSGFDEMIKLTEEGKLWKYPIDNEQGLEEEKKIPFYDHVFLEEHLEGFPDIPEIHNFMELVLIGLGKNPYLTVEQKKEHIEWFRKYFENKITILQGKEAMIELQNEI